MATVKKCFLVSLMITLCLASSCSSGAAARRLLQIPGMPTLPNIPFLPQPTIPQIPIPNMPPLNLPNTPLPTNLPSIPALSSPPPSN
nr:RNA-binding protein 12 [Ipomoea trifida]GME01796.1 protein PELPK2-like [Ipomoea batatas]